MNIWELLTIGIGVYIALGIVIFIIAISFIAWVFRGIVRDKRIHDEYWNRHRRM